MTPTRFSGSVALTMTRSPVRGSLATWASCSTHFGQRVLLTGEPGDEPAAPHQAAVLESAQRPLQLPPREPQRVVHGEVAEDHAPAVQQLLGHGLGELVAVDVRAGGRARATTDRHPSSWSAPPRSSRENRRGSGVRASPTRARIAPKPSEVSRPRATPSHSPRSTSSGRRRVACDELGREAGAPLAQTPPGSRGRADRRLRRIRAGARGLEQPGECRRGTRPRSGWPSTVGRPVRPRRHGGGA